MIFKTNSFRRFITYKLYIDTSTIEGAGRGVFTGTRICKGATIDKCPIIWIPPDDEANISNTILDYYWFDWDFPNSKGSAIALGMGSLFNHSNNPNAKYTMYEEGIIIFEAIKTIREGDEIFINYHGDPTSQDPIEF